jgi:membrane associated rhomboid family serine protease
MLFPIGDDDQELREFHLITYSLIAINVLVFIYELILGNALNRFFLSYSVIPLEIYTGRDLKPFIAPLPVYTTLFTSIFMHGGFAHILGNMLYLWIFGDNVEEAMGSVRFLFFYLLCGVIASLAHVISNPLSEVPSLGASGAIAGVLGGYLVLFPQQRVKVWMGWLFGVIELPAVIVIGLWGAFQLISGVGSLAAPNGERGGIAYWAHIGGFIAGLALVFLFRKSKTKQRRFYIH